MINEGFIAALVSQKQLPLPLIFKPHANTEDICRSICGLLNENGGWIVIGMDANHSCVGIDNDIEQDLQKSIVSCIAPLPLVYVQAENYDLSRVLLVTVMKGSLPPYTYKGAFYVMQGTECVKPDNDQMACLFRDSYTVRSGWEADNCLIADEDMLNSQLMSEVYSLGRASGRIRKELHDMNEVLSELQLRSVSSVTNGALTLFAKDTTRILPQCRLRIQVMLQGKTASTYEDAPVYIIGNIFDILHQVLEYFKNRLPMVMEFSNINSKRKESYFYPLDVIDEAVSNALIHRDYTSRVDEITIFIYADKIEITNTGVIPKGMLSSMNKVLPHNSVLRNPLMAEVFYISGEMEKTGRGLALISDTMRDNGSKLPEWRIVNGKTTLTIYSGKEKMELSERAIDFLHEQKRGYSFSKAEYASHYGVSLPTAYLDIKGMSMNDRIDSIGKGPQTRYIIK